MPIKTRRLHGGIDEPPFNGQGQARPDRLPGATVALVSTRGSDAPAKPDARAHSGGKGAGRTLAKLKVQCPISNAVNFGTWYLESTPHPIPARAAQLIGAAAKAPLQSTIDDNPGTSGAEESPNPNPGILDKREMSGDLFTTTAGPEAAGSEGVTAGSRGNTSTGEPDPVPAPANPNRKRSTT